VSARQQIEDVIRELDPKLKPTDRTWMPAMFLAASLMIDGDAEEIASALEADLSYIEALATRASANDLWVNGRPDKGLYTGEGGGVAFWCDVSVLAGDMDRKGDKYSLTAQGKASVERLIGGRQ
jgi:hypothetical protein